MSQFERPDLGCIKLPDAQCTDIIEATIDITGQEPEHLQTAQWRATLRRHTLTITIQIAQGDLTLHPSPLFAAALGEQMVRWAKNEQAAQEQADKLRRAYEAETEAVEDLERTI